MKLKSEQLDEAIEYYRENSFGYYGIENFVSTEYMMWRLTDEEVAEAVRYIRDHL